MSGYEVPIAVATTAIVSASAVLTWWLYFSRTASPQTAEEINADFSATDPGLLKKHSVYKDYDAAGFTFPSIRTFYHKHPQAEKLPTKPSSLPLLVFIHGLGGSVAQFSPLLTSLINIAPCLAIDLPGCGLSAFEVKDWEAYRVHVSARLVAEAIRQHLTTASSQKVVLIGHSLGCSIAALLASSKSPLASEISKDVVGVVAICPRTEPLSDTQISHMGWLPYIPETVVDFFRWYDRRGGLSSASVTRYVGRDADQETKRLQLKYNEQSRTPVFLRMLFGLRPSNYEGGVSGLPGQSMWMGIKIPIFAIAGERDHVNPPQHLERLANWFGRSASPGHFVPAPHETLPIAAGDAPLAETDKDQNASERNDSGPHETIPELRPKPNSMRNTADPPAFALKTAILPKPAGHGLLYATATVRIVSGLIESFLATQVDHRLTLGWQLQHLTTEGKWDVKNLEKWQKIQAVSEPIGGIFRAMKTLREVDEEHTPKVFVKRWGASANIDQSVRMVVDISHESPVYDPKGLEEGGVEYHKFPTVSKLPPTVDEVRSFIALIDTLRVHLEAYEAASSTAGDDSKTTNGRNNPSSIIAVHCHYGFNRTGFFIVSYLVERMGYQLQDAIREFAEKRTPGIRHEHFVNELFVRYSPGLQRRPTIY